MTDDSEMAMCLLHALGGKIANENVVKVEDCKEFS